MKNYVMINFYTHKYVLHLSYLGTNFSGWQIQDNANTIQGLLMEGLHNIVDPKIPLMVGAGRTDTGVHAINYFAHFESFKIDATDLKFKLNRFLPNDIVIHNIFSVNSDFHARYSAISRKYEYWISTEKDPFLIGRSYYFPRKLNIELMNLGAQILISKQDFSCFSKSKSDHNICDIKSASWFKSKNMLIFKIEADRFLYNMVRCIVGTLIQIGLEKLKVDEIIQIIYSKNRSSAGYSVPAYGLYLLDVQYPKIFQLESI
tara:strand:+ start:2509 stop:3288 length:780 start_codon:yes stop_codon:yes gene_type:complete